jgi:hypothetical protein
MVELLDRLRALSLLARQHDIGLNIDAEEPERLEVSLDLLQALWFDPAIAGWNGIGLAVQAHQKRVPAYLVRRLLENGSNSSFINRIADPAIPLEALVEDLVAAANAAEVGAGAVRFSLGRKTNLDEICRRHQPIALPCGLAAQIGDAPRNPIQPELPRSNSYDVV